MGNNTKKTTLEELERQHSEKLLEAGRAPAGSSGREALLREADVLMRRINELCEAANPTPLA